MSITGRVRHLDREESEDVEYLLQLVRDNPDYFLNNVGLISIGIFIGLHLIESIEGSTAMVHWQVVFYSRSRA